MTVMGAFGPKGPAHRWLGQTGTCTGHAQGPTSDNAASTLLQMAVGTVSLAARAGDGLLPGTCR